MGMPVKLSNDLVTAARAGAQSSSRSITAQIEHWALLGRAAEAALSHADVLALKSVVVEGPEVLTPEAESTFERIRSVIHHVAYSPDRSTVLAELQAFGTPLYEGAGDGKHVVRVDVDGTATYGRYEDGRFLPGDGVDVGQ